MISRLLHPAKIEYTLSASAALLLLRLVCGAAFVIHGLPKIKDPFHWLGMESSMPGFLQLLAALSEFGGGIAWILGFLTPLASFGIACTMATALGMHILVFKDPFISGTGGGAYELPAVFFCVATVLFACGPGRFSLDALIFKRHRTEQVVTP